MKAKLKSTLDSFFWKVSNDCQHTVISKVDVKPFAHHPLNFRDEAINKSFGKDNQQWFHHEWLVKVTEPTIIEPQYASAISGFNNIIQYSLFYEGLKPSIPAYINFKAKGKPQELEKAILFDGNVGNNYFHFYSDVLHKLWVLEKHGIGNEVPLIISKETFDTKYFQYFYKNTLLKDMKWVVQDGQYIKVDEVYLVRPMPYEANYWKKTKEILLENNRFLEEKKEKKVFITRRAEFGRYISNMAEIETVLKKYDFEVMDPTGMGLEEQISIFANTRYLVSIHGAGNTNIVVAPDNLKFVEIAPENYISSHYYWLATSLGFDYDMILGGNMSVGGEKSNRKFVLSPDKLETAIQEMLSE